MASTICGLPLAALAAAPSVGEIAQIVANWHSELQGNFFDELAALAAEQWNEVHALRFGGTKHATTDQQYYWIAKSLTPLAADLMRAIVAHYDAQQTVTA